jgi:hypothetical protein
MRVRSAIATLASWSCSCSASLSSDRIGLSWSKSFAATALALSSRIQHFRKPEKNDDGTVETLSWHGDGTVVAPER